jgi:nitrogenase-stabilizing/protective protein
MRKFLDQLEKLSSAEEFLEFLNVPYDPHVVSVNRLHILKRFHDYIGQSGLPGELDSVALGQAYARALDLAYRDFVTSDARTEKVFKVCQQADASRMFVPLASVSRKPR